MLDLKQVIRSIPDFPKPGIVFRDITTLLQSPEALRLVVDGMAERFSNKHIDMVVGAEARGFIFGPVIAYKLGAGFAPVRKAKKLPFKTIKATYSLEYGTDSVEIHADAIKPGQRVLMVDDLLATGGTMAACCDLVEKLGGVIVGCAFVVELSFLNGRDKLRKYDIVSLVDYDSE
ncbi:MAG TPA: adenine phosphoribosyltransferase [Planctomycetota bacterium]|nr:adenine phosphoribosyltransferase [Planctomycetota bacterium]